jgi:hypothetical protein
MIPDEYLLAFRLDEALRHLREAEQLAPEGSAQWRFVLAFVGRMAAQASVEAARQEEKP